MHSLVRHRWSSSAAHSQAAQRSLPGGTTICEFGGYDPHPELQYTCGSKLLQASSKQSAIALALVLLLEFLLMPTAFGAERPNVLLVMIDDMGYGDLSCHGSPFIKTPELDSLHSSGVRLLDFHVAPMCSPTRGQLLTGMDALRNGSSVVASSRMMVRPEIPMAPAMFTKAGYATGIFGKWHLGENYPHRPEDRGFQETLWFPMQEIGSLSDHWQNDYFDPVLRRKGGRTEKFTGYSTDIFVNEAIRWMKEQKEGGRPFFCYVPLNVVHGPQWAPEHLRQKLAKRYPTLEPGHVGYLAMLANADENFGKLEAFLRHAGLRENTIVLFLSDNGGYALVGKYNAGMRGGKSRLTEGGHRVPCFVRWPAGGIAGGRDVSELTQVQDLLPTLLELCGISDAEGAKFNGASLAPALRGKSSVPDRTLVLQYGQPRPFHMTCVMQGPWRLLTDIKGTAQGSPELYNLASDPMQKTNLVLKCEDKAKELRAFYDRWWAEVEPFTRRRSHIHVGHKDGANIVLTSAEWRENAMHGIPGLRQGIKRVGIWDVEVTRTGKYQFALRRWPESSGLAITAGAPAWTPRDATTPDHAGYPAVDGLPITRACLRVGDASQSLNLQDTNASFARFELPLDRGQTEVEAWFEDSSGNRVCPAYFVSIKFAD